LPAGPREASTAVTLSDKVILISGVGPGLGRATARAALEAGARVVLGDLRGDSLTGIAGELDPSGARTAYLQADISLPSDCRALVDMARDRFGKLDALVHVAATDSVFGGLMDGNLEELSAVMEVNLRGTLELTRVAVPLLRERATSSVVMVGSTASVRQGLSAGNLAYGASKGALVTAVHHLASELGPLGIRVNTVAPGWKWGPVLERYMRAEAERAAVELDVIVESVSSKLALRRLPDDDDVAAVIAFFCSDGARSITGQTLFVDCGEIWH
jgi:NAD(P)-dependent dehydrogenase (short-subunit alcohol dehydrogenase family)